MSTLDFSLFILFYFIGYLAVKNKQWSNNLYVFLAKFLHGYLTVPETSNNRQSPFRIMPSFPDATEHQQETTAPNAKPCTPLLQLFLKDDNSSLLVPTKQKVIL